MGGVYEVTRPAFAGRGLRQYTSVHDSTNNDPVADRYHGIGTLRKKEEERRSQTSRHVCRYIFENQSVAHQGHAVEGMRQQGVR